MMFSATSTEKTEALKKLALKKEPVYVGVDDAKESATVDGLEQGKYMSQFAINSQISQRFSKDCKS